MQKLNCNEELERPGKVMWMAKTESKSTSHCKV